MELTLESGRVIAWPTEADVRDALLREEFAILSVDGGTYIQFAERKCPPYEYHLEYQDGGLDRHYQAADGPITMERVVAAFFSYLRGESSYRSDFRWERMEL